MLCGACVRAWVDTTTTCPEHTYTFVNFLYSLTHTLLQPSKDIPAQVAHFIRLFIIKSIFYAPVN